MPKIFIIAELGNNFLGNIDWAKKMIWAAKKCGADACKFQLYDIDKIKKPWESRYFELMMGQLTFEQARELKEECDKAGIEFMASCFDTERVGWCEELGVKRYKLASRSIRDTETIKAMEKTKKPIIASLGGWNEIGAPNIKNAQFLFCVSEYPAYITNSIFPSEFDEYSGFSDHSIGTYWCREAAKRGATIIEKHFTLDKHLPGHDQKGSADPTELKDLVTYIRQIERGVSY